jgi:hypothetical protein
MKTDPMERRHNRLQTNLPEVQNGLRIQPTLKE